MQAGLRRLGSSLVLKAYLATVTPDCIFSLVFKASCNTKCKEEELCWIFVRAGHGGFQSAALLVPQSGRGVRAHCDITERQFVDAFFVTNGGLEEEKTV